MSNTITVRMPKTIWDKWEAEMLDPNNKQAVGTLFDGQGYCCLGLLQKAVDGNVERLTPQILNRLRHSEPDGEYDRLKVGDACLVPNREWLNENGIEFRFRGNRRGDVPTVKVTPDQYDGISSTHPLVSELNDAGIPFPEICALIRNHLETY